MGHLLSHRLHHNTTHDLSDVKNFQLYLNVALLLVALKVS